MQDIVAQCPTAICHKKEALGLVFASFLDCHELTRLKLSWRFASPSDLKFLDHPALQDLTKMSNTTRGGYLQRMAQAKQAAEEREREQKRLPAHWLLF